MGILDFDWMDFNHDGKVDDAELVFGLSILEDDMLLESGWRAKNAWDAEDAEDAEDTVDSDGGEDTDWF